MEDQENGIEKSYRTLRLIRCLSLLLVSGAVLSMLLGCKKDTFNEDFEPGPIMGCHNGMDWTEEKLENALMGEWNWVYHKGGWSNMRDDTIHQGKVLSFKEDKRIEIHMGTLLVYSGNWKLGDNEKCVSICHLEMEPRTSDFLGSFALCDDQLLVRAGIAHGFDSFYEKK